MQKLLSKIAQANEIEIDELLKVILRRYAVLCPNREVSLISLPKEENRNEQLDMIISVLQKMKTDL